MDAALRMCWKILPAVSRSFALPIRILPRPTGDAVMLSYLVFRIADTLEDCCPDERLRTKEFRRFREMLDGFRPPAPMTPEFETGPYKILMMRSADVARSFALLPTSARFIILEALDETVTGMQSWKTKEVGSFDDLHDYCYYVAGVVGKMLTRLFSAFGHVGPRAAAELEKRSVDFGIALQMVNVIRDVRADHRDGRHYWPSSLLERHGISWTTLFEESQRDRAFSVLRRLGEDALEHCDTAFEYLTWIPSHQIRIRSFCALPLYMAVSTVRRCLRDPELFSGPRPVKIGRGETRTILSLSLLLSPFNAFLDRWYRRLRSSADLLASPS